MTIRAPAAIAHGRGTTVKTSLALLVIGLGLAACASPEPPPTKSAVLTRMLATSAQIFVEREGGVRRAGSGVILAIDLPNRQIAVLTTAHLLEPQVEQLAHVVAGAQRERTPAVIVAIDSTRDLALMVASLPGASEVVLASRAELADEILIVAYPWGRERTVVKGAVSQIAADDSLEDPFAISGPVRLVDATVSYGMSGGGVFDKQTGDLVGLVRGYRTAHLSLSSEQSPLKLPIAGETTVISTRDILCFLRSAGYERLTADSDLAAITDRQCRQAD